MESKMDKENNRVVQLSLYYSSISLVEVAGLRQEANINMETKSSINTIMIISPARAHGYVGFIVFFSAQTNDSI
jgi:hypothetical protein